MSTLQATVGPSKKAMPCQGCGKSCVGGMCISCEAEMQRQEPPEILRDYRWVYGEQVPTTPSQVRAKQLYDEKPDAFLTRLERMEKEWRKAMPSSSTTSSESPAGSVDEGTQKIRALIAELKSQGYGR